ncbi:MAG: Rossmann-like and DUF2520 domain-containing protein [Chitinophagales bacterium]
MKISIIGSGNVATVMGRKILGAGHEIMEVFSPTEMHAISLAKTLGAYPCSTWEDINKNADLYLAAISDPALNQLSYHLSLQKKLIVHTAGSVSIEVLKLISKNFGVLYPLQSLRKELSRIPEIPFLVDGNSSETLALISDFASSLSDKVQRSGDEERLKLHLASIIVNNFTNHLYGMAEKFCFEQGVQFKLLLPLIDETAGRMHDYSPNETQTGPAFRKDWGTISKHLELLAGNQGLQELYALLSKSIMERNNG